MYEDVRRGRVIVATYAVLHVLVLLLLLGLSILHGRPWQRVVVRALTQGALVHSLWRGSRWAQWLHVIGFLVSAALMAAFAVRRPRPVVVTVSGLLATICVGLAWLFAASRSIRAFLAYQRGEILFADDIARLRSRTAALATADGAILEQDAHEFPEETVACRKCGTGMKEFVVVCPHCGVRRE